MKETRPIAVGRVVRSKAGRDAGRYYIVMSLDGDEFVWVSDGKRRGLDRQKRKRRKHLYVTAHEVGGLKERLQGGTPVENYELRAWLEALTAEEE